MCSLFLRPESAMLFDGYGEQDPQKKSWGLRPAAARLAPYLPIRLLAGNVPATPAAWHATFDPINRYGLVMVNSHGSPAIFHVADSAAACARRDARRRRPPCR